MDDRPRAQRADDQGGGGRQPSPEVRAVRACGPRLLLDGPCERSPQIARILEALIRILLETGFDHSQQWRCCVHRRRLPLKNFWGCTFGGLALTTPFPPHHLV